MSFADSYIGRLRSRVGHEELLVPGAQVLLIDGETALFQRRVDTGEWEIPAGSAEPGQSFAQTAIAEVHEELGLRLAPEDLIPFASFSDPLEHRLVYPNGDVVHAFALCFAAHSWEGEPAAGEDEVSEWAAFPLDSPPRPLRRSTERVLELYRESLRSRRFQAA